MAMVWHSDLFPKASEAELQRTKFLLSKYKSMCMLMDDFEKYEADMKQVAIDGEIARRIDQEDLHADKTANAVIVAEKQRWVYEKYKIYTFHLRRAAALIPDEDAGHAIQYRYLKGHSFKETVLFFRSGMSDSTVRRKLLEGTASIAGTLKLIGFFDQDNAEF
ncbi:hypothetical protein D3P09_11860 [Paenibacillus pinisoli]|uniref:ArpU family transcriptional regulator n=1 Tax=Paenibacillus pinisoli TaxID=1276110 RepID=A0A3A6Q261_9BACL|nr:hypothetical protein [Paenibacillus pinisoli]RJX40064.1 hypothetical protein D3P09_11860 [Paenibacillus pinisoli]